MRTFKRIARRWQRMILAGSLLLTLISTTGCWQRFVAVDKNELVQVPKGDLDRLYQDNELLLDALKKCRGK